MAALVVLVSAAPERVLAGRSPGTSLSDLDDRGTFDIVSGGRNIGTETFEIRVHGDHIEAQSSVHLQMTQNGKNVEVRTTSNLLLDSQLNPLSYTWNQKGTQSSQLSADFRAQPAHVHYKTVGGQEDRRDFHLEKDVVVLDDNAVHQYELAVARYDAAKGGVQTFRAFVPQEAAPGIITLNSPSSDQVNVEGRVLTLRRFLLSTEAAQISLWVDEKGHLQMVSAPDAQFQAMRKK